MIATMIVTTPYLQVKKDATECSFRSFKIVTATNTKDEPETLMSHLSQNTQMILRQTIGKGAKAGHGLGKNLQGIQMVISLAPKCNRYSIGYQPSNQGRNDWMGIQKENRRVRSDLVFPPLNQSFKSRGYINSNQSMKDENLFTPLCSLNINVITKEKEMVQTACPIVYPCSPNFELNNQSIVEIPVVHRTSK